MIVKATLGRLRITEVPTTLSPDGRDRPPHIRSWRDGWRHLRFLLMYSPRWLFLYPGLVLTLLGMLATAVLIPAPFKLGQVTFDVNTLLYAAFASVIGVQLVAFAVISRIYATSAGLLPSDPRIEGALERFSLEFGVAFGGSLSLLGFAGGVWAVLKWRDVSFGPLARDAMMRLTIPSATAMAIGVSFVFTSFLIGIFRLPRR